MRILYHSAAPWVPTGYGTCTKEIAPRLNESGHDVAVQCLSSVRNSPIWWHGEEMEREMEEPMKIYDAGGPFGIANVKKNFHDWDADILFTHFDTWMEQARDNIPEMGIPYASYVIVDHEPAPKAVTDQVANATETICMSEYAEEELNKKGVRPSLIPHGVDTEKYHPDVEPEKIMVKTTDGREKELFLDDVFLFGMVAANHGDRKNIPNHLRAFEMFLEQEDEDAVFYIHTDQRTQKGFFLNEVVENMDIPKENIIWARRSDYEEVSQGYLNNWYNAFDVMLNCSMGESWGLTITEAMAAETPAVVTNFSSMPEQLGVDVKSGGSNIEWVSESEYGAGVVGVAPHGLVIEPSSPVWREQVNAKQYICSPENILQGMKFYYHNQHLLDEHGEKAREHVVENYDWENSVLPKFTGLFDALEGVVK